MDTSGSDMMLAPYDFRETAMRTDLSPKVFLLEHKRWQPRIDVFSDHESPHEVITVIKYPFCPIPASN